MIFVTMGYFWFNHTSLDNGLQRVAPGGHGGRPAPDPVGARIITGPARPKTYC